MSRLQQSDRWAESIRVWGAAATKPPVPWKLKGLSGVQSYSETKGQQAILDLAEAMADRTGNMPYMPAVSPDYAASIVRNTPAGRKQTIARGGMPSPVFALKDETPIAASPTYAIPRRPIAGGPSAWKVAVWCCSPAVQEYRMILNSIETGAPEERVARRSTV